MKGTLEEPAPPPDSRAKDGRLHQLCSAPIAQAMLRYWDIAATLKDLREEQKLVSDQWGELFQDMATMNVDEWLSWAFGGESQEIVRAIWEARNPRFRLTRRGVERRPNDKDQMAASQQHPTRDK